MSRKSKYIINHISTEAMVIVRSHIPEGVDL